MTMDKGLKKFYIISATTVHSLLALLGALRGFYRFSPEFARLFEKIDVINLSKTNFFTYGEFAVVLTLLIAILAPLSCLLLRAVYGKSKISIGLYFSAVLFVLFCVSVTWFDFPALQIILSLLLLIALVYVIWLAVHENKKATA